MEAIVLAGGLGTRLRSVVSDVPKPMAKINGRPFLEVLLNKLVRNNIERIVLSTGYKGNIIKDYFGTEFNGVKIEYSHEDEPLGTGGAICRALEKIVSNDFFVFNGDTFADIPIDKFVLNEKFRNRDVIFAKVLEKNDRYGSIVVSEDGKVVDFLPKPKEIRVNDLINSGCYHLTRSLFADCLLKNAKFSFEIDFLPIAIVKRDFFCCKYNGVFIDIGIPEDYERAQVLLKKYIQ